MHRIDTTTASANLFGSGKNGFTDGDAGLGVPVTNLNASWFNDVQEEICNVIESNGGTLVAGTVTQLLGVLRAPIGASGVTGGNAISATGGVGSGGTGGVGLKGIGGATNGIGTWGVGTGSAAGAKGTGGPTGIGGLFFAGGLSAADAAGTSSGQGVDAYGAGTNSGVRGTGGFTDGTGGNFIGGGTNGSGAKGTASGTGIGLYGLAVDGYGVKAESDTTSPAKAALRIVPQDADPSVSPAAGDVYADSNGVLRAYRSSGNVSKFAAVGEVIYKAVPMTAAEFKNAHTTAKTIVATPSSGRAHIPLMFAVEVLGVSSTAYAAGGDTYFRTGALHSRVSLSKSNAQFPPAVSNGSRSMCVYPIDASTINGYTSDVDGGFEFFVATANFTTGDATFILHVWYVEMDWTA